MSENTIEVEIDSIELQSGGIRAARAKVTFENGLATTIKNDDEVDGSDFSTEKYGELESRKESGDLGSAKVTVYTSNITPDSRCTIKEMV